jgi:TPR repeat protein
MGLPQNQRKAKKLWLRAGEHGEARGHFSIGVAYYNGEGVGMDTNKAKYYYELAAVGGNVQAQHNLGCVEEGEGNMDRAVKHWMIAAEAGHDNSLAAIRACFLRGHATKDDFERALRAHKEAKDEMRSEQREAAAAYYDEN